MKQHRVDALQPFRTVIDERLAQPHLGAQIEDVRGRDPGLGQALSHQQLAQQPGVELVGLGTALAVLAHPCLRGLGKPHLDADTSAFLGDEAPPRHRLDRRQLSDRPIAP